MIVKQMEIRANIKKYFDLAYSGDVIIVPRIGNKNVVIISEEEYNRIKQADRLNAYALFHILFLKQIKNSLKISPNYLKGFNERKN